MADGDLQHAAAIEDARCALNDAIRSAHDHGLCVDVHITGATYANMVGVEVSRVYTAREVAAVTARRPE